MSSFSILFFFVAIVVFALLALNFLLAPRNPYLEKQSAFECGFHSFSQTRSQFHLSFFMYAIIYLILDLELILLYPYALSTYENGIYGLVIMLIFTIVITIGFIYELGSGALQIDSRQNFTTNISRNPDYNFANFSTSEINSIKDNTLRSSILPISPMFFVPFLVCLIQGLYDIVLYLYALNTHVPGVYYLLIVVIISAFYIVVGPGLINTNEFVSRLCLGAFSISSKQTSNLVPNNVLNNVVQLNSAIFHRFS